MQPSVAEAPVQSQRPAISHGPFTLDLTGFTVTVNGRDVPVTFTEFLLLKELAGNPRRNIDRARLLTVLDVRAFDFKHGASPLTARTVDLHISRLRRKLKQSGYDCIRTMRFVGYRFVPAE